MVRYPFTIKHLIICAKQFFEQEFKTPNKEQVAVGHISGIELLKKIERLGYGAF